MTHISFIYNTLAFFFIIIASTLSIVNYIFTEKNVNYINRLYLLFSFFLVIFPDMIVSYLMNSNIPVNNNIFFMQQLGTVFLISSLPLFVNSISALRYRKFVNVVLIITSVLAAVEQLSPFFINADDIFYFPVAQILLCCSILYVSLVLILVEKEGQSFTKKGRRFIGVLTLVLFPFLVVFDIFGITEAILGEHDITTFTPLFVPFFVIVLSIQFVKESVIHFFKAKKIFSSSTDLKIFHQLFQLSDREVEVLNHLIAGLSYESIANNMFLSKSTVKTYISRLYQKTEVNTKIQLINKINRTLLVQPQK